MHLDIAKYKVSWGKMPSIAAESESYRLDKALKKSWKTYVMRVLSKMTKRNNAIFWIKKRMLDECKGSTFILCSIGKLALRLRCLI